MAELPAHIVDPSVEAPNVEQEGPDAEGKPGDEFDHDSVVQTTGAFNDGPRIDANWMASLEETNGDIKELPQLPSWGEVRYFADCCDLAYKESDVQKTHYELTKLSAIGEFENEMIARFEHDEEHPLTIVLKAKRHVIANQNTGTKETVTFPHEGKDLITVFTRGTDNKHDIWTDLLFNYRKFCGHRCHSGFTRVTQRVLTKLKKVLEDRGLNGSNCQIQFAGHSLGGSVATLLAVAFSQDESLPELYRAITFGAPMVTNEDGAKAWNDLPIFRIWNLEDAVPSQPILWMWNGSYHHFGKVFHLVFDRKRGATPKGLASFIEAGQSGVSRPSLTLGFADHSISKSYIENIIGGKNEFAGLVKSRLELATPFSKTDVEKDAALLADFVHTFFTREEIAENLKARREEAAEHLKASGADTDTVAKMLRDLEAQTGDQDDDINGSDEGGDEGGSSNADSSDSACCSIL